MSKPIAIDLFCGLGGWTEGLLAAGYDVIGFDNERHEYGEHKYPAQLVLQDVLTLHGSQFKGVALIVASPPCQKYSYMAMPWTRAKKLAEWYRASPERRLELTALFDSCFRLQREAIEAAGHHVPLVVENVRGAQPWVGRSNWNYGSFHVWGDVPALMPMTVKRGVKVGGLDWSKYGQADYKTSGAAGCFRDESLKRPGFRFDGSGKSFQTACVNGIKNGGDWFGPGEDASAMRNQSSKSPKRKAASALIAKIPFELAHWIARAWLPQGIAA